MLYGDLASQDGCYYNHSKTSLIFRPLLINFQNYEIGYGSVECCNFVCARVVGSFAKVRGQFGGEKAKECDRRREGRGGARGGGRRERGGRGGGRRERGRETTEANILHGE